ncbi:hypothetical protein GYMLUDRAFT_36688 [Collybiopsis luxurians FD-317 M1]|nr:hypothetical protein GYMLUDRAFT_36688 [Collybiopsis luxurians FD-317 M1]
MGTTQSYLSPEVVVTAAVVAGAVGFGYKQVVSAPSSSSPENIASAPLQREGSNKKGKGKKKSSTASGTLTPTGEKATSPANVVPFPAVIPGQFDESAASDGAVGSRAAVTASSSQTKKGKKKKAGKGVAAEQKEGNAVSGKTVVEEAVIPPAASELLAESPSQIKPSSKSKKKKQQVSSSKTSSNAEAKSQLQKSTVSVASLATESDGEWTRVSRRTDKGQAVSSGALSDVGQSTSITTDTSSQVDIRTEEGEEDIDEAETEGRPRERNLLEKKLLAKPRKTGVEDMLATSDYPSYSRIMRVQPGENSPPGPSWVDHENFAGGDSLGEGLDADGGTDADGEDEGWGVVKRGGRPKKSFSSTQQGTSTARTASAPETLTKRQRQNAARREAEKSAKAEAERQREAALAQHRRQQESARIEAQYAKGTKNATSGGMKASVDERGKLIWD